MESTHIVYINGKCGTSSPKFVTCQLHQTSYEPSVEESARKKSEHIQTFHHYTYSGEIKQAMLKLLNKSANIYV